MPWSALGNKKKSTAVLAVIATVLTAFVVCPAAARADEIMAHSVDDAGNTTNYYTTDAAISAGYGGKTICLDVDWMFTGTMTVADSKSIAIDMNGHKITSQGNGPVIRMYENSSLTLTSSEKAWFKYDGYDAESGEDRLVQLKTGGLITGGSDSSTAGGIRMDASSTLTLDGVTVGGNSSSSHAGGIYTKKNCKVYLKNGASIQDNKGKYGGGIYVDGADTYIYLYNASSISDNYAENSGGGIYSNDDATRIQLEGKSTISGNTAIAGGGVYFNYSWFYIVSEDKTGSIKDNKCIQRQIAYYEGGGAVYVCRRSWGSNEGMLKGLTVSGNTSQASGGAIRLVQEHTRVVECTITGNKSKLAGGGICIDNQNNIIESCTITNNSAGSDGGGVYVIGDCDVELTGTCIVQNNTNAKDNSANDIYLSYTNRMACITGGVDAGSKVGVLPCYSNENRFGKDITTYTYGTYFINRDGYYVTHGSDEGGDLWQRKGANNGFTAKVNGVGSTLYKQGATVTANGTASDSSKHFWYWDASSTTGLSPVSSYITDDNMYSQVLTYTMPQNDTDLKTIDADLVTKAILVIASPVVGEELPTTATFRRSDGGVGAQVNLQVPIAWYTVSASGARALATGKAKAGTTYVATISIDQHQKQGLFFSQNIAAADVTIRTDGDTANDASAASASVDAAGTLAVEVAPFTTDKPTITKVKSANVSVTAGTSKADLLAALPATARAELSDDSQATLATDKTSDVQWDDDLFDGETVIDPGKDQKTFTVKLPLASSDTVASVDGIYLAVTVTVLPKETVAAPTLSAGSGTYDKYNGSVTLDADGNLTVTASCATDGATIKYKLDDGDETKYSNAGIALKGKANATATHTLEVWAEKGSSTSEHVKATYKLADTLGKSIEVACSDTALYAKGDKHWGPTFTATGDLGSTVTITAPVQDGRVFDHWEWDGAPKGTDLSQDTLTIEEFSLSYDGKITAVYTPVVSKIDLDVSVPQAHKALAKKAGHVKVGVGTDEPTTDITSYFANDAALTWTPSSGDGEAAHATTYSASLSLETTSSTDGVKYALADTLQLYVNGTPAENLDGGAYISEDHKTVFASFPDTGAYDYKSLGTVLDSSLSFEEAYGYQANQDAGKSETWGLSDQVQVTYQCGETEQLDITWNKVEGFDADATGTQELKATGTVTYPSYVDTTDGDGVAPTTVTATVKVAAPETVEAPTASVAAGTYDKAQTVELSCATEGATIHYTTDGSEPTEDSPEYTGDPIEVTESTTLKVRAFRKAMTPSKVVSLSYVFTVTVTFDADGGECSEASRKAEKGVAIGSLPVPTKDGYSFDGWYNGSTRATAYTAFSSDVTLTAKWRKAVKPNERHLVTFIDGDVVYDISSVKDGKTVEKPADPEKDGYSFKGWYADKALSKKFDFDSAIEADTTVYAKWEKDAEPEPDPEPEPEPKKVTVTFDADGGACSETSREVEKGVAIGSLPVPTKDGLSFDGWYDGSTRATAYSAFSNDVTLTAKWRKAEETVERHLVTFLDGDVTYDVSSVRDGEAASRPADPAKDGYTFKGWYADEALTKEFDFASAITADTTVYAKWEKDADPEPEPEPEPEPKKVTVTFDADGGACTEASHEVEAGAAIGSLPLPTKDGYSFDGWYDGSTRATAYTAFSSDVTLTAKWRKAEETVERHLVTFHDGDVVYDVSSVKDGASVEKPADPEKDGYSFKGWYADEALTKEFDFASAITADTTVYAKWEKDADPEPEPEPEPEPTVFTVTFMDGDEELSTQKVEDGKAAAKPEDPTKDGHSFKGWYADAELTEEFDFSSAITADTTVYAKWEKDAEPEPEPNPDEPVTPDAPSDNTDGDADGSSTDTGTTQTTTETTSETTVTTTKAAETRSTLSETGDAAWVFFPVAIVGIAIAVFGTILAKRRSR